MFGCREFAHGLPDGHSKGKDMQHDAILVLRIDLTRRKRNVAKSRSLNVDMSLDPGRLLAVAPKQDGQEKI
jgi:hypothetical protein